MTLDAFSQHPPHPWFEARNGELIAAGQTITEIAARAGRTPFYLYDRSVMTRKVALLRAALPDTREEASTLRRELRMAHAYLELVSLRTGGCLRPAIEVPAPLHATPIAPALLMPLLAALVPHRCVVTRDGIDVRIDATSVGGKLRVEIARNGGDLGDAPTPLALNELQARLRDLYGDTATLTVW